MELGEGRVGEGGAKGRRQYKTTCCGIVCREEFLKQFSNHRRTESDGCQTEENSIALEHNERERERERRSFLQAGVPPETADANQDSRTLQTLYLVEGTERRERVS